jgi:membrane associated rhomboid family serine protease
MKKSPLRAGLIFGLFMFVFVIIYQIYQGAAFDLQLAISGITGGLVGGLVYGGIEWLKQKNKFDG